MSNSEGNVWWEGELASSRDPASRFASVDTPAPILDRLHKEAVAIFAQPEVRANLEKQGMTVSTESRAEFAAFVHSESKKYEKVIAERGIKLSD